jgi:hypothetical protein
VIPPNIGDHHDDVGRTNKASSSSKTTRTNRSVIDYPTENNLLQSKPVAWDGLYDLPHDNAIVPHIHCLISECYETTGMDLDGIGGTQTVYVGSTT